MILKSAWSLLKAELSICNEISKLQIVLHGHVGMLQR